MIEHESHTHPHHTKLPWLDITIAGSAIFISIVSLVVSIQHGRTMEKLVEANEKQVEASTLPILRFGNGNLDSTNTVKLIHFGLRNGGTGPAIIQWFRIKWNGQPTNGPIDFLNQCCRGDSPPVTSVWRNMASGLTLTAGQDETVFSIRADNTDPNLYKQLDSEARFKIEPEACYCSVLDMCWITDFQNSPRKVSSCEPIPDKQRW